MDYNTFEQTVEQMQESNDLDAGSLYHAMQQVPDGRKKRGVRYSVALILTLILLGKVAGMTTPQGVCEWVRLRAERLRQLLPMTRPTFPCAATYSNVLQAVDAAQVNEVLTQALQRVAATKRCEQEPSRLIGQAERAGTRHLALDGKTLRGTLGHEASDQKPMHQLGLYETKTGLLLKELVTAEKQNELSIVAQFLTPLWVKGRILTADALHTQHAFCLAVTRWEGDYVLIVKANQPTLREDLELFFRDPPLDCRDWRTAHTCDKGHGRRERREIIVSNDLNDFLASQWAGIAQVFQLTRTVVQTDTGETRTEVVYGITSLTPLEASADDLLHLVRDHWAIENRLHWRRDVTLREDSCQVRKGEAPRVLAVLNSFLLAVMDFLEVSNVAQQMRIFDAHPEQAVRLLLGPLLTFK
jgi:predicted transposase YbfD/YdcC